MVPFQQSEQIFSLDRFPVLNQLPPNFQYRLIRRKTRRVDENRGALGSREFVSNNFKGGLKATVFEVARDEPVDEQGPASRFGAYAMHCFIIREGKINILRVRPRSESCVAPPAKNDCVDDSGQGVRGLDAERQTPQTQVSGACDECHGARRLARRRREFDGRSDQIVRDPVWGRLDVADDEPVAAAYIFRHGSFELGVVRPDNDNLNAAAGALRCSRKCIANSIRARCGAAENDPND
jgi:hypothetical protein